MAGVAKIVVIRPYWADSIIWLLGAVGGYLFIVLVSEL